MHQGSLFESGPTLRDILDAPIRPRDPNVTEAETPRLSRQCGAILERLRQGTATNRELATIALKYTGRLSDLRAAGYRIDVVSRDHTSGLTVYQLGEDIT